MRAHFDGLSVGLATVTCSWIQFWCEFNCFIIRSMQNLLWQHRAGERRTAAAINEAWTLHDECSSLSWIFITFAEFSHTFRCYSLSCCCSRFPSLQLRTLLIEWLNDYWVIVRKINGRLTECQFVCVIIITTAIRRRQQQQQQQRWWWWLWSETEWNSISTCHHTHFAHHKTVAELFSHHNPHKNVLTCKLSSLYGSSLNLTHLSRSLANRWPISVSATTLRKQRVMNSSQDEKFTPFFGIIVAHSRSWC